MTINRLDPSTTSSIVTSDMDLFAMLTIEINRNDEAAEREAMRDEREAAEAAGEARLGAMSEAADFRLAAGIVSGTMKIGSSIASGVGAAHEGPDNPPTGAPEHDDTTFDQSNVAASSMDAASDIGAAIINRYAEEADERAERARMAADRANSRADERHADAGEASSTAERALEGLSNVLSEKRRAEEAATRA